MRPVQHLGWWSTVTSKEWDTHYWRIRGNLKRARLYEGDEGTQRQIAVDETTEQFGPRPGEAP